MSSLSSSSSCSSRASSVKSEPGPGGKKRNHSDMEMECTGEFELQRRLLKEIFQKIISFLDSCDCEEFGQPLAKRINRMNIEHPVNGQINITVNKTQASLQTAQMSGSGPGTDPFVQKYPFPQDSPYFSNNLLLSKLYAERVSRNPHLKHDPT